MVSLLPLVALVAAFQVQTHEVLHITTVEESSITIYSGDEEQHVTRIGNTSLTVCLSDGDTIAVEGVDRITSRTEADRMVFEGSFDIQIKPTDKPSQRIRVTNGQAVAGPFDTTAPIKTMCGR